MASPVTVTLPWLMPVTHSQVHLSRLSTASSPLEHNAFYLLPTPKACLIPNPSDGCCSVMRTNSHLLTALGSSSAHEVRGQRIRLAHRGARCNTALRNPRRQPCNFHSGT